MGVTRDPETQAAIDAARQDPGPWFGHALAEDPAEPEPAIADSITLTGPELAAYRVLRSAAEQAHAAQQSMAVSGQRLRDAIAKLCAVIAPGGKP